MGERTHEQAFWFFALLVGLGVEQALESVAKGGLSGWVHLLRILVFLFLSLRLLFGASEYFNRLLSPLAGHRDALRAAEGRLADPSAVGEAQAEAAKLRHRATEDIRQIGRLHFRDFMLGSFHFLALYVLSFAVIPAVPTQTEWPAGAWLFPVTTLIILLWDMAWWLVFCRREGDEIIEAWAYYNLFTALTAAVAYLAAWMITMFLVRRSLGPPLPVSEIFLLSIVLTASLIDLFAIYRGTTPTHFFTRRSPAVVP